VSLARLQGHKETLLSGEGSAGDKEISKQTIKLLLDFVQIDF